MPDDPETTPPSGQPESASATLAARRAFLRAILGERRFNELEKQAMDFAANLSEADLARLLTLDRPGHVEDKNFAYHLGRVGPALAGFLASPNFRHSGGVTCLSMSPDGTRVLSGSQDNSLKVWDVATGRELRSLAGHQGPVNACAWSPDGWWLVSGSDDQTLRVWRADTGECVHTFNLQWIPRQIAFSRQNPRRLCTANGNGTLTLFDLSLEPAISEQENHVRKC